jgi:flagellar M-ring protein FliF
VVAGLFGFLKWSKERDFRPLYTGVAAEDAGAVVAKLKESGAEYRVTDGGATILVPSGKVAETRLQMAALGLPKTGRIGYELFDKTNFGATDFTEQVNYHRALEGELERSVMALAEVEKARVHITLPKNSLFVENRQPAKASVMIKLRGRTKLAPQNILAITYLVASAVDGLAPEGVSLLDMQGNLLSRPRKGLNGDGLEASDAALDYRQRVEKDLLAKINSSLEPVLGADKFRSGVSVDCDFTSGEQSEETFDPNKSVMVSAQKTEDISGGTTNNGVPGAASNLPRPTSRPGAGGVGTSRKTENISYQSSRMVKRLHLPQGNVKRMSVSVLVDHTVRWEGVGPKAKRIIEPPAPEKLKVIKELVAGVVGLQTERGDQLIVESLPFESTLNQEAPEIGAPSPTPVMQYPSWLPSFLRQLNGMLYLGLAGAVAILLLFACLTVMLRRRKKLVTAAVGQGAKAIHAASEHPPYDDLKQQLEAKLADNDRMKELQHLEALQALQLPTVKTQKTEVLTKHLSAETKKDPQAMAHVIRTWLNER